MKGCVRRYTNIAVAGFSESRAWVVLEEADRDYLLPAGLPRPGERAAIEKTMAHFWSMLRTGDAVRLDVRYEELAPSSLVRSKISTIVARQIETRGFRVKSNAEVCLQVSVYETTDGEPVEYYGGRFLETKASVPDKSLHFHFELIDREGVTRWEAEREVMLPYSLSVRRNASEEDVADEVLEKRWEEAIETLEKFIFPSAIEDSTAENGFAVREIPLAALTDKPIPSGAVWQRSTPLSLAPDPAVTFNVRAMEASGGNFVKAYIARDAPRAVAAQWDAGASHLVTTLYDLESRRPLGSAELPEHSSLSAFAPDGNAMVIVPSPAATDRSFLTVWEWKDGTAHASSTIRMPVGESVSIDRVHAISANRLLVESSSGKVWLYDLATGEPLYALSQWPAVSPGGKWLATIDPDGCIEFRQPDTRHVVAKLEQIFVSPTRIDCVSFSPDGERLAVIGSRRARPNRTVLACWDLEVGQRLAEFELRLANDPPLNKLSVFWCGTDYLLIGERLFDLRTGLCVWTYRGMPVEQLAGGRVWTKVLESGHWYFIPVTLPGPLDLAEIESKQATIEPVLKRGERVQVELQGIEEAPYSGFSERLAMIVGRGLRRKGYKPADDAAWRICVSVSEKEETPRAFYRLRTERRNAAPRRVFHVRLQLLDSEGTEWWGDEETFDSGVAPYGPTPEALCLENGEIIGGLWAALVLGMSDYDFPASFYDRSIDGGFGRTEIEMATFGEKIEEEEIPVEEVEAPAPNTSPSWTYEPDAIPTSTAGFTTERLALGDGSFIDARFAGPEVGQVAALMSLPSDGKADASRTVRRLDLRTARILSSFEVPKDAELLDFRLDGRVIAMKLPGAARQHADQLAIWACSDQGDDRRLEFAPYHDSWPSNLTWAAFAGTNRLITLNPTSTLDLWQLPEGSRLASVAWKHQVPPPLSAQHKYMAVPHDEAIEILDTGDFSVAGRLSLPNTTASGLQGGAFDSDGMRLGLVMRRDATPEMTVWNLATGELIKHFPTNASSPGHQWIDTRYYYAGGNLVDVEAEAAVTKSDYKGSLLVSPDGRFWYGTADAENRACLCVATLAPAANAEDAASQASEE